MKYTGKQWCLKTAAGLAAGMILLSGCGTKTAEQANAAAATATAQAAASEAAASETAADEAASDEAASEQAPENVSAGESQAASGAPEKPEGAPPDGAPGQGGPGGERPEGAAPAEYDAVETYDSDETVAGEQIVSEGKDENAILVTDGTVLVKDSEITRTSERSSGGDNSSFYGVGAAALCTGGTLKIEGGTISTDADGGAGAFAYGEGTVYISDTTIRTEQDTSGGIHAAGGGTLYADNVTAETNGASSAAVRSDRGGGKMVVTGGEYTSHGSGSPAVYCTADIEIKDAKLTATGAEAVCIEGRNSLTLENCELTGSMPDDEQNDSSWTVIIYQSMSGDAEEGCGSFSMKNGKLTSTNGGLFCTTNTESRISLESVQISAAKDCEYLLQCTGNTNDRGWGSQGANGADCVFTATNQTLMGDVIWDSISKLEMSLLEGSNLTGAFVRDETWSGAAAETAEESAAETEAAEESEAERETETAAEQPAADCAVLHIDAGSIWIVTADSVLTSLENKGMIVDVEGLPVTILDTEGNVLVQGDSPRTVTVGSYTE